MLASGDRLMDDGDSGHENLAGTCPCPLKLVTMAGKEIDVIVPVSIYHHWEMLEDYLVELLATKSFGIDTFGCELKLVAEDTLSPLSDPIHEVLWDSKGFQLVIQESFHKVGLKEQIRREEYDNHPKAIWVCINESGILPAKAFFAIARLRHVQVEAGYHTIERQAWRYCHTLTIVKLPSSVVAVANAVFQGCYALTTVAMPGCVSLGARLFAECCALEKVGVLTENSCRLARGAALSPYAFEGCEKLVQIGLPSIRAVADMRVASSSLVGLPAGCFHSAGIREISVPRATAFIGNKACAQCQQLIHVDLSQTQVNILHTQVFSHCRSLTQVSLPKHLTEIGAEAFEACESLCTVALPQQLRDIGHRAFAGCRQLVCLTYRSTKVDRRRLQVAANAFEGCQALAIPGGICYLSMRGKQVTQRRISWGGREVEAWQ